MQAHWNEVKKDCLDMSLTTEFGELKWPLKPADAGKRQETEAQQKEVHDREAKIAQENSKSRKLQPSVHRLSAHVIASSGPV